jgi:hypothetical protein
MTIDEIIQKAVNAQRIAGEHRAKDAFKATEKRLYSYPIIRLKIEDDRERIEDIRQYGAPAKSKSVVMFRRTGQRLTPEEIAEARINDLTADIAGSAAEIETIDKAMKVIEGDPYEDIIRYKYFEGKDDDEIAGLIFRDMRTVRRQKSRLVSRLAVFLYGVEAI